MYTVTCRAVRRAWHAVAHEVREPVEEILRYRGLLLCSRAPHTFRPSCLVGIWAWSGQRAEGHIHVSTCVELPYGRQIWY